MNTPTNDQLDDSSLSSGKGSRFGRSLLATALVVVGLPFVTLLPGADPVQADPAPNAASVSQSSPGALSGGTVPDGTCYARITATGGGGASGGLAAINGGRGGAAAIIEATFRVLPGQTYSGSVGGGGQTNSIGGVGGGGDGGTIVNLHRGAGGGGRTVVTIGGLDMVIAGGGGGGGAAHDSASPQPGNGGAAGTAVGAGVAAAGTTGSNGVDNPGTNVVGGGQGGQVAAGGLGGQNSGGAAEAGADGGGIGSGTGGMGGPDLNYDSAGGGGAGYTGGGGGSSTVGDTVTGAGGGGGSSWVAGTSPTATADVPTAITGASTGETPQNQDGVDGSITIDWVPCQYDLAMTKTVATSPILAGDRATWTVTVTNDGPDAMNRGDTISLADTLPTGPNAVAPGPDFRVVSIATSGGSNANLLSGAVTCTGVTVGSSMPASTVCSRPYAPAGGTPGNPPASSGTRGLNVGETLTIVYEQVLANTANCATLTNTATVTDRPTLSGSTDIVGVPTVNNVATPLVVECYDLAVTKSASPLTPVTIGDTITWTVTVTNLGPASMNGPVATDANPLVVTESFPSTGIGSATLTNATGPAGNCTLVAGTVTCDTGLGLNDVQTLTFTQTVVAGAVDSVSVANTASVSDPLTGDSNDSATAAVMVRNSAQVSFVKSWVDGEIGNQVTLSATGGTNNPGLVSVADTATEVDSGSAVTVYAGETLTLAETFNTGSAANYATDLTCTGATDTTPSDGLAIVAADDGANIVCTYTNTGLAGVHAAKTGTAVVGPDAAGTYQASYTVTVTNSGIAPAVYGPLVDTPSFDPNLIISGATWTTSGPGAPADGSALGAGPYTLATASTPIGHTTIHTFTVTISFTFATYTAASACAGAGTGLYNEINLASGDLTPDDNTACLPPPLPPSPTINVAKSALPTSVSSVGQAVAYSFLVTNTGNVTLTGVVVTDPLPGLSAVSCPVSTLAPSASTTCTANYTTTQADLDAGSIANTATAAGTPPVGSPVTDTGSATVTANRGPAVTITKSTTATTFTAVGQSIPFTIAVRNSGNVTLTNVVMTDPNAVLGTCTPAAPATLAPNQTMTCSATHAVTQADMTALSISNTAYVAAESGVLDVSGTSNIVLVPGVIAIIPATGLGIAEPLKLVVLLVSSGLLFLIASRRRRQFYLVLPPL
ncbi:MAG: hypothetical protein ABL953_02970 [Ilumatobacteraceae bacterium]